MTTIRYSSLALALFVAVVTPAVSQTAPDSLIHCYISCPDTLRFITDEMRYEPDTFDVVVVLINLSDSILSPIHALIGDPSSEYIIPAYKDAKYKLIPELAAKDSIRLAWKFCAKGFPVGEQSCEIPFRYRRGIDGLWATCSVEMVLEDAVTLPKLDCWGAPGRIIIKVVSETPLVFKPNEFDVHFGFSNTGRTVHPGGNVVILHPTDFDIEPHDSLFKFLPTLKQGERYIVKWQLRTTNRINRYGSHSIGIRFDGDSGESELFSDRMYLSVQFPWTDAVDGAPSPDGFILGHNYPNPFTDYTTIEYTVPRTAEVSLRVYDALGREVAVLTEGMKKPGDYSARFVPHSKSPGVYLCVLSAGNTVLKRWVVKAR